MDTCIFLYDILNLISWIKRLHRRTNHARHKQYKNNNKVPVIGPLPIVLRHRAADIFAKLFRSTAAYEFSNVYFCQ